MFFSFSEVDGFEQTIWPPVEGMGIVNREVIVACLYRCWGVASF